MVAFDYFKQIPSHGSAPSARQSRRVTSTTPQQLLSLNAASDSGHSRTLPGGLADAPQAPTPTFPSPVDPNLGSLLPLETSPYWNLNPLEDNNPFDFFEPQNNVGNDPPPQPPQLPFEGSFDSDIGAIGEFDVPEVSDGNDPRTWHPTADPAEYFLEELNGGSDAENENEPESDEAGAAAGGGG